ncbi:TonB-dependent receptor [Halomonas campisalis]|uniref:TonB-dependent receptor n=1 Tax=Billgrantia campisalis TaxID=74661 RepID=A0ABS9P7W4_9GAMM|nr:TonB-dependent receptor [Halomonas campisalis]MCG6657872.1 TonB-dependent receptor [Halomonas campisalis]MDR5863604.1 TonB-dependent receptor [Halomonas campisalis]
MMPHLHHALRRTPLVAALSAVMALPAQAEELDTLVISASGFEQTIELAPASISIITREELEERHVTNLAEAVRGIEGVNSRPLDARSGKTGNQTVSLRGLPSEYTLVLIDGVRQNVSATVAPNAFNDSQSTFIPPIAAIERIEVVRGPMSTLYGSDAIGGVINIITRRPGNEWRGAGSIATEHFSDADFGGTTITEGYVSGPISEHLGLQLYGRLLERAASSIDIPGTEPSLTDNRTMGQNPTKANVETFGGELVLTPHDSHDISLRFDTTQQTLNNRFGQVGRFTGTGNAPEDFERGYSRELVFERDQFRLSHRGDFAFGQLDTSLTRDIVETKGRTINAGAVPDADRFGTARQLKLTTDILDTRLTNVFGDHLVTLGGQYLDATFKDGFLPEDVTRDQYSLFAENEWQATQRLALTGGLRYDKYAGISGEFTPRAYAVFEATDEWTLKGGAGQGFRAPLMEQTFDGIVGFGDGGSVPLFGDPDLKPERSTNYEVSARYDNRRGFMTQVTAFHNTLKDKIERATGASDRTNDNIGESRIQGIELASSYAFTDTVTLSGNYTYTDSELKEGATAASLVGDPLVSVPEHMLNLRLDWQATPQLNAFLGAEYRSSAFRPRNFHEPQNGGRSQGAYDALGDFRSTTMVNLGGRYRVSEHVSVNGVVNNLLDRDFKDYRPYVREDNGNIAYSNVYNNLYGPRSLMVSLNVDF